MVPVLDLSGTSGDLIGGKAELEFSSICESYDHIAPLRHVKLGVWCWEGKRKEEALYTVDHYQLRDGSKVSDTCSRVLADRNLIGGLTCIHLKITPRRKRMKHNVEVSSKATSPGKSKQITAPR